MGTNETRARYINSTYLARPIALRHFLERETLETHLIKDMDTYGIKLNDYDAFVKSRARAIALALNVKLMSMTLVQAAEAEKVA